MSNKLNKLLNPIKINEIINSECDNPHEVLGPHIVGNQVLFQFFYPGAMSVKLRLMDKRKDYPMQMINEAGYFAILLPLKEMGEYRFAVSDGLNKEILVLDSYRHAPIIGHEDTDKFKNGIHYEIYELLGAHPCSMDGDEGTYFAVWAPNAVRVSVVGDFNSWDGRMHQMRRLWDSGIFEIFIPQAMVGMNYKFEIKCNDGQLLLKADPYANFSEIRPNSASVIEDISDFQWTDQAFLAKRELYQTGNVPINIYELYIGSFVELAEGESFANYRRIAPKLVDYVKRMNYTHVQFMPIMEHPLDESWGYQVLGFYAPTSRYGTPEDFMFLINALHVAGIGVILDWVPSQFPKDAHGLSVFDGTCLYEHLDSRKSEQACWGTKIFNYSRPEVSNYLIANALFWINKYHIDGIQLSAVASMLYLDYCKSDNEWVPNMYGGNENLDAIEFMKHLNSIIKKLHPGVITIAEDHSLFPCVTEDLNQNGLGFDLKWNNGFTNDYFNFIKNVGQERKNIQNNLILSTVYAYSEKFLLAFSHDDVAHGKGSIAFKMPGTIEEKFANLRLTLAYKIVHPGKKLSFMGQDMGVMNEWNEKNTLSWKILDYPVHKGINQLCADLNSLYRTEDALYFYDDSPEGFEWINSIQGYDNFFAFTRRGNDSEEVLVVVVNVSDKESEKRIGVPFGGSLTELINTDHKSYGGSGYINAYEIQTEAVSCDNRSYSALIKLAPYAMSMFRLRKNEDL